MLFSLFFCSEPYIILGKSLWYPSELCHITEQVLRYADRIRNGRNISLQVYTIQS
jgi:hypothetical protein